MPRGDSRTGGPDQVAEKNAVYREAFASRDPADQVGVRPTEHLAALCPAIVLDDGAEARRLGIRGQRFFMESIGHWGSGGATPLPDPSTWIDDADGLPDAGGVIESAIGSETVSVDFSDPAMALRNPNHGYGTVEDCIGYVERLVGAGADEILFLCQMGTIPQEPQLETLRNLGEHVIPWFREGPGRELLDARDRRLAGAGT